MQPEAFRAGIGGFIGIAIPTAVVDFARNPDLRGSGGREMARTMNAKDAARREAARVRAEASRRRHAEERRPSADVVDAALAEALIRVMESSGWREVDGRSQVEMKIRPGLVAIQAMLILAGERGFDRHRAVEALTARLRRTIRPRRGDGTPDLLQAS